MDHIRPTQKSDSSGLVLVVQRFRRCSLWLEENKSNMIIGEKDGDTSSVGLITYVSFAKGCDRARLFQAARTLLNLPVLTLGIWGDGSETQSVMDIVQNEECVVHLVVVPQANLICKVKSQGKSIQYHGQVSKDLGKQLYDQFVDVIRAILTEHICSVKKKPTPKFVVELLNQNPKNKVTVDPSVPPSDLFKDLSLYSDWNDEGFPTKLSNGEELSKSASKKLRKQMDAQVTRFNKYKQCNPKDSSKKSTNTALGKEESSMGKLNWKELLDPCSVVAGTFGSRQGLEIISDMGPFCHVVNI